MESITFGVEIEILVRPKLDEADLAQEFEAECWNKEQSLSNRERRTNIATAPDPRQQTFACGHS